MEKLTLKISGMHCASCSAYLEKELSLADGIKNVSVSIATNTASFEYDADKVKYKDIELIVKECGFSIETDEKPVKKKKFLKFL